MIKDPQERRALTAIVLCMAVFWLWSAFFGPQPVPVEETAAAVATAESVVPAAVPVEPLAPVAALPTCSGAPVSVKGPVATLLGSDCGGLTSISFPAVPAAIEVTPWWTWAFKRLSGATSGPWKPYGDEPGPQTLLTEKGDFLSAGREARTETRVWITVSESPLVQSSTTPDGLTITRSFTPDGADPNRWDVAVRFSADKPLVGPFWIGVSDHFDKHSGRYSPVAQLEATVDGDLEQVTDPSDITANKPLPGPVNWFGVADKYFLAAVAPAEPTSGTLELARVDADRIGAYFVPAATNVSPSAPIDLKFKMYAGQRELGQLGAGDVDFTSAVSLGWFGFFAKILIFTLEQIQNVVKNWGASILVLTLLTRLAVYPLTRSAVQSGRKMQALQPELKALQEKYADDKETLNREMMALWSRNGVNPLGGCFPVAIQMPVFFALFAALTYEPHLFHATFGFLRDLSEQDPYGITGVLIVAGMYVQQSLTPMAGMEPSQQQMMKLMPLIFGFMMFSVPSGLALYYVLNTVLAIVQQWYNTRSIPLIPPGGVHVTP